MTRVGYKSAYGTVACQNLESPPRCYLLWGVPGAIAIGVGIALGKGLLSLTEAGILYTLSVAWMGTGCFLNGRSCGRVHCRIDGIAFPLLALAGVLNVLSLFTFSWGFFWLVFIVILVLSFVPEWTWKKYSV